MNNITDKTIKDTGERMVPAYHKGHMVYGEHTVRYEAAAEIVRNKVVLDIASGSGYGSSHLSMSAKKVYGVDVDADAIKYSQKNYSSKNVSFMLGDGTNIPLDDNSVDVVISFETIEHIEDYTKFMEEVKRVLKDDGIMILSTPNDIEFPESNHFHIHEFERRELERLVSKYFSNTESYFQGTWLYNALLNEKMLSDEWEQDILTTQTAPIKDTRSIYFYMLCSNRKIYENIQPRAAISEHWSERKNQEYENSIRKHMDDQAVIIKHLKNETETLTSEISALKLELDKSSHHIASLLGASTTELLTKVKRKISKK